MGSLSLITEGESFVEVLENDDDDDDEVWGCVDESCL
jgi:hypothetical protein